MPRRQVRFRMDGAFFRKDELRWLTWREVGYAIKVPFYRWLDLQQFSELLPPGRESPPRLFDPDDGHYEIRRLRPTSIAPSQTSGTSWPGGAHEKTIAQLKSELAFGTVPTLAYAANSAWQQLAALTHNLLTNFQIDTRAERRRRSRQHTALPRLSTVQTLRFTIFHRAGTLLRTGRPTVLRMTSNPATERLFTQIEQALPRAA